MFESCERYNDNMLNNIKRENNRIRINEGSIAEKRIEKRHIMRRK